MLILPMPFGAFQPPKAAPGGPTSFPRAENKNCWHLAKSAGWRFEKKLSLIRTTRTEFDPVLGLRWSKSSEQHG